MDSLEREKEARDHRFEEFVLEQVKRYGVMEEKVSKVFMGCAIACVALCILGIAAGKPVVKCLLIGMWCISFWAGKEFYREDAEEVSEAAIKIRAAIDDPDFDIPDDYPQDILGLRDLVCPTLKNIRTQAIAYGVLGLTCWAGAILILWVSTTEGVNIPILIGGIVLGATAFMITFLAVRAIKDIPVARAYEQYLNEVAQD